MHIRNIVVALFLLPACVSCRRNAPDTAMSHDIGAAGSDEQAHALLDSTIAADLIGEWELQSTPPQRFPGLQIAITVDSVAGVRYFGRLTSFFSGNVGQDPNDYEAFSDSIGSAREVTFTIAAADDYIPGMRLDGTLGTDTIVLDTFVLGPDTVDTGARRWFLTRRG